MLLLKEQLIGKRHADMVVDGIKFHACKNTKL
jgi:hypothetical protein